MNLSSKYKISEDLYERFPRERFTMFKIPYIIVNKNIGKLKIIEPENSPPKNSLFLVSVFKRFTWAVKNDLLMKSQDYNKEKMMTEVNREQYYDNCVKELLIVIINEDNGKETWIDEASIKKIDKDIISGIMNYFFSHTHFETMSQSEEWDLRKSLHKYFRYWQLKGSPHSKDQRAASMMDAPICPSIVWKTSLAERFGWDFNQIENISEKDLRELQILNSQEKVNEFESDSLANCSTTEQIIAYDKKLKMQNEQSNPKNQIEQSQETKNEMLKSLAQNHLRRLKGKL